MSGDKHNSSQHRWLQTRCEEWNTSEGERKDKWTEVCTKKYRRVPQTKHMSLSEMEESLKGCGDAELEEMKGKAEPLITPRPPTITLLFDSFVIKPPLTHAPPSITTLVTD